MLDDAKSLAARTKVVNASGVFRAGYDGEVPSPCVSICRMTADRSRCEGCFRSIDEIRAWSKADTAERLQIWQVLLARAQLTTAGRSVPTDAVVP
ncbi:hypothetical protein GCM10027082_03160 [Comamonas humi]